MPLMPQDVHSKVFGPTRFRRGYDEAEVDAFLDEVEAELTRLHREIDALRAQLGGQQAAPSAETADAGAAAGGGPVVEGAPDTAAAGAATAAAASLRKADAGTGSEDLEQRVARTLVLAQRAADEAVRDAETQAEQVRSAAAAEAERLRVEAEQEAAERRAELERNRSQAEEDVEQLRAFEREYRTRLRAYLELQLRDLDAAGAQVEARQSPALEPSSGGRGIEAGEGTGPRPDGAELADQELADAEAADRDFGDGDLADPEGGPVVGSRQAGVEPSGVDPADVPSSIGGADDGLPPSVAVDEYADPGRITRRTAGEETRHDAGGTA